jgi:hypothetical protein
LGNGGGFISAAVFIFIRDSRREEARIEMTKYRMVPKLVDAPGGGKL